MTSEKRGAVPRGLLVFGYGGHARTIADIALNLGVQSLCFVDENGREGENLLGHPVVTRWDDALPPGWQAFSAAGDSRRRAAHSEYFRQQGWQLATLIAPDAVLGLGAAIGAGSLIAHLAYIGPFSVVGEGCIVNTAAVVDHECALGDFSHVSARVVVAGRVRVGSHTMLGVGAAIIDGIEVGSGIMVGAGAVVHRSILEPGTYVGVPARRIPAKE